jgi:predicted ATPase/DNA-binding CsgD family transcriptional regulator
MARTTPVVRGGMLTGYVDAHERQIRVGTPTWYAWLEEVSTFAFTGNMGTFTARKEPKLYGGELYWKAYRKRDGKLYRAYLGKSQDLTLERLHAIAAVLAGAGDDAESLDVQEEGRAIKRPSSDLPIPLTALIGREQEQTALCTLLQRSEVRLLTLTGTGGVGKTRLALQVAMELMHDFADGAHFVSLAPLSDPALVVPTIAHSMGLMESGSQSLLEQLKTSQHDKQRLLLLDNFEHIITAAPLLAELLEACPALKLLVTSREALRLRGEHQFAVLPLALPDPKRLPDDRSLIHVPAVDLFLQRAQAIQADFHLTPDNARAIAEICLRLDGLPLAIELAAARIKMLAPQVLLARLDRRLPVLTAGARDLPLRQQTLRNTLAWSYELLTHEEQHLFQRMSVFAGGATLEAVEAVYEALGDEEGRVFDGVASLLDKSLVHQQAQGDEEPRFLMLQTVREFGLELLAATGELQTIQAAHAHYFLALAEQAEPELQGPHATRWLEQLEQEHDNLRGALAWLYQEAGGIDPHVKAASRERALRFFGALWSFWYLHCHYREGMQWLQAALALLAEESVVSPQVPGAGSGNELRQISNQEKVQALSPRIRAKILTGAGVFEQLYNPDGALSLHEDSLHASRSAGDSLGMIAALIDLAWVALRQANYEQAERFGQQSLTLGRAVADTHTIAASLAVLGIIALHQHKYEQARPFLEESLHLRESLEERSGCAHLRTLLGHLAVLQGEYTCVIPLIVESMKLRWEEGNRQGIAMNLVVLTELAVAQNQPHRAVRLLGARHRLYDEMELRTSGAPLLIQDRVKQLQMTARAQLGEATYREMWAEGQDMELARVLTYALEADLEAEEPVSSEQEQLTTHETLLFLPQEASASVQAPSPFPAGLTAREREVLQLLARGLSNAQIAEELVVSLLTVKAHLRSIYSKLGVTSRVGATRYAVEHHLS